MEGIELWDSEIEGKAAMGSGERTRERASFNLRIN
jgi:hypothetical protein